MTILRKLPKLEVLKLQRLYSPTAMGPNDDTLNLKSCFHLIFGAPPRQAKSLMQRKVGLSGRNDSSTWFLLGSYYVYTLETWYT
ncbi:hypothetical protein P3S68_001004 [Capsicum galapagoense]